MAAPANGAVASANSADYAAAVTPTDTAATRFSATRGLWVGGAGNVTAIMAGDEQSALFVGVPAGTVLPIRCIRVASTGTTATSIVALY